MHAQGDAGSHQERRCVIELVKLVAADASVFHLVPMATRVHAHVMQASERMEISPSALEFNAIMCY